MKNSCLACGSKNLVLGALTSESYRHPTSFRPDSLRFFTFTIRGGVPIEKRCAACRDCGFVSTYVDKTKLEKFIIRHCNEEPR
jgi:hypothetical protein